jgi:hypothetical protein
MIDVYLESPSMSPDPDNCKLDETSDEVYLIQFC